MQLFVNCMHVRFHINQELKEIFLTNKSMDSIYMYIYIYIYTLNVVVTSCLVLVA